ncbi:unnamed protein product, partial [Vitis vinifera]
MVFCFRIWDMRLWNICKDGNLKR